MDATPTGRGDDRWRTVEVSAERVGGWIERFEARHGVLDVVAEDDAAVRLDAADGAVALVHLTAGPAADRDGLVAAATAFDRFGLVLVRRGGFAVGSVEAGTLAASRCGTRYVQGRTKAGGWSQQRYARRRANQADALAHGAADAVVEVLRERDTPLVCGGDRGLVRQVLELSGRPDDRLIRRWLDVPDPRRSVLVAAVARARAARIDLNALA